MGEIENPMIASIVAILETEIYAGYLVGHGVFISALIFGIY